LSQIGALAWSIIATPSRQSYAGAERPLGEGRIGAVARVVAVSSVPHGRSCRSADVLSHLRCPNAATQYCFR
jgi:hypothetical protein